MVVKSREMKKKTHERKRINKRKLLIGILLALGFGAMEFPGILLVMDRVEPFLLGLPFLYGYILCCWAYMCMVFFYAYRTGWGKHGFFHRK